MGVVFDKLGFMRKLEGEDGFTRPQAERLTEAFYDAVVESVATKQDLNDTRTELKQDIGEVRHELGLLRSEMGVVRSEMGALRSELKGDVAQLRSVLKQDMAGIRASISETRVWAVSAGASVIAALAAMKFFG